MSAHPQPYPAGLLLAPAAKKMGRITVPLLFLFSLVGMAL